MADEPIENQEENSAKNAEPRDPKALSSATLDFMSNHPELRQKAGIPEQEETNEKPPADDSSVQDDAASKDDESSLNPFAGLGAPKEEEKAPEKEEPETPVAGKDFPSGAKQWKEWREKEQKRIRDEFEARMQSDKFTQLETSRAENSRLQEELAKVQERLEKVAFTETEKYTNDFVRPKEQAVRSIEAAVHGSGEGAKSVASQLIAMMQSGTLTPANYPDVSALNDLQKGQVSQAVTQWMMTHQNEQDALSNWQTHREQYLSESRDIATRSRQEVIQEMSTVMQNHAMASVEQLSNELPGGFTEEDRMMAAKLMSDPNQSQAYIGKAVMAVPALTRQLRESITEQRSLEAKLKEIEQERDELQDALGSYQSAGNLSGQGNGARSAEERPRDKLMRQIGERMRAS